MEQNLLDDLHLVVVVLCGDEGLADVEGKVLVVRVTLGRVAQRCRLFLLRGLCRPSLPLLLLLPVLVGVEGLFLVVVVGVLVGVVGIVVEVFVVFARVWPFAAPPRLVSLVVVPISRVLLVVLLLICVSVSLVVREVGRISRFGVAPLSPVVIV